MGNSKKNFAIVAIIVGAIGIGIGAYTLVTVGNSFSGEKSTETSSELQTLMANGSPVLGSKDAPITILEFGDYQCPNCMRFATQIKPLIVKNYIDTGKAKLVFKDFTIYGNDSILASIATHCAGDQNMYWEMHDAIYENQKAINSGWINTDSIRKFASEVGLDMQQFNTCFDDRKYREQVKANFEQGKSIGIDGTPTFLIIDKDGQAQAIKGAQPYDVFKKVLDEMLVN